MSHALLPAVECDFNKFLLKHFEGQMGRKYKLSTSSLEIYMCELLIADIVEGRLSK